MTAAQTPGSVGRGSAQVARGKHKHTPDDLVGPSNKTLLEASKNLSDVADPDKARDNLSAAAARHTHVEGDVTALVDDLASKVSVSEFVAKGDLLVGTGAGTAARLPVGDDKQILTASPDTDTGITWENRPATTGGGFDPNEDPIIIGAGAEIDAGAATPDNPNSFYASAIVLGQNASAGDPGYSDTVVIGRGASSDGGSSVVIGASSAVHADNGVVLGPDSSTSGEYDVAVGSSATASGSGTGSVAIGEGAGAAATNYATVAVGSNANAGDDHAVAVGEQAVAQINSVAVGGSAAAHGEPSSGSVAIGVSAKALGPEATVAVGFNANVNHLEDRATAVGANTAVTGSDSVAVGESAVCSDDSTTAVGAGAQATAPGATAIGFGAVAAVNNQVMLGTPSNIVTISGAFDASLLPTVDPGISGQVWNNGGILTVSP